MPSTKALMSRMNAIGKATTDGAGVTNLRPTKLFIGGITKTTTTEQLRDHFSCYGRVLDCVAMKEANGKARGFGYVTLDSSQAAECCLASPQVINGRIVDLKRAVPEGSMDAAPTARLHTPGASSPKYQPAAMLSTPGQNLLSPTASWPPATAPTSPAGGLWPTSWPPSATGFSFLAPDCIELLSTHGRQAQAPPLLLSTQPARADLTPEAPGGSLSAAAPEFVPQNRADSKEEPRRSALGEITNTMVSTTAKQAPEIKAQGRVLEIDTDSIFEDSDPSLLSPPGLDTCYQAPASAKADIQKESADVHVHQDNEEEDEVAGPEPVLPSLGSSDHASGTCKRCNFFAKGHCQNGAACSFCHFPHDKRKPSRQEKQERKGHIENQTENCFYASYQADNFENDDVHQTMAYPIFPGMPPMQTTKLPAPLALPGTCLPAFASSPAVAPPPGLLLQTSQMAWQPEEEISPQAVPVSGCTLLSTVPVSPLARFTGLSTTPAQTSLASTPVASKVMVTMATQTDEDDIEDNAEVPISRDMLLKFRHLAGSCNSGIRAESW